MTSAPLWITSCPDAGVIPTPAGADTRAETLQQVLMLCASFCAGVYAVFPTHLLPAPQPLLPRVPNSWISSQAAANTDALSFEIGGGKGKPVPLVPSLPRPPGRNVKSLSSSCLSKVCVQ